MDNLVNEIPEPLIPEPLIYEIPEIPEALIYEIPIDNSIQPKLTPEFLEFINNTNIINLRNQRNQLLKESDKYLLPDFPITTENLELIKDYREKLRNFNENNYIIPEFPF